MCTKPKVRNEYFSSNLQGNDLAIANRCKSYKTRIQLRDTQSYVTGLLKQYASPDKLDVEAFVNVIESLANDGN